MSNRLTSFSWLQTFLGLDDGFKISEFMKEVGISGKAQGISNYISIKK